MNVLENIQHSYNKQFWERPNLESAKKDLCDGVVDPQKYYSYAIALLNAERDREASDVLEKGINKFPLDAFLYFARGRVRVRENRIYEGLADYTMALTLIPDFWNFWYYRATTYATNSQPQKAISDFNQAAMLAPENERAPIVHWLYTTYLLDLKSPEKAKECLKLFSSVEDTPQQDYGYVRSVKLYQGHYEADNFIDLNDMKEKCVKRDGRIDLELQGMYYALFAYYWSKGEEELAKKSLLKALNKSIPNAFAYKKALFYAVKMGLVEENAEGVNNGV